MSKNAASDQSTVGLSSLWKEKSDLPRLSSPGMLLHLTVQAWRSFITSPITSSLTIITIATTLLIFAIFILFIENVKGFVGTAQSDLTVNLYLSDQIKKDQIVALTGEIEKTPEVESVTYRSKDQAMTEFREVLGEKAVILEGLEEENPLPASLEVHFQRLPSVDQAFDAFAERFGSRPEIERVDYSRGLLLRISEFLKFFRWAGFLSIFFMLLITSFIITNTIKLALYSHREEIEIMKLVGATDGFVRAPYMIEGFFQGLIGAFISLGVSYSCYLLVHDLFLSNEELQVLVPTIQYLSWHSVILVLLSGVAVGIFGSYLAVRKFLSA